MAGHLVRSQENSVSRLIWITNNKKPRHTGTLVAWEAGGTNGVFRRRGSRLGLCQPGGRPGIPHTSGRRIRGSR
jgi:hypothetical protein